MASGSQSGAASPEPPARGNGVPAHSEQLDRARAQALRARAMRRERARPRGQKADDAEGEEDVSSWQLSGPARVTMAVGLAVCWVAAAACAHAGDLQFDQWAARAKTPDAIQVLVPDYRYTGQFGRCIALLLHQVLAFAAMDFFAVAALSGRPGPLLTACVAGYFVLDFTEAVAVLAVASRWFDIATCTTLGTVYLTVRPWRRWAFWASCALLLLSEALRGDMDSRDRGRRKKAE